MCGAQTTSVFRAGLFLGRVAVVTGGGTGIGKAIATELASLDCRVVIASRSFDKLCVTANEINDKFRAKLVTPVKCNIRDEAEVSRCIPTVKASWESDVARPPRRSALT